MNLLGDERRIRSNPVWWWRAKSAELNTKRKVVATLQLFRKLGVHLPASFVAELIAADLCPPDLDPLPIPRPGPVGLTVFRPGLDGRHGFVVPLLVQPAEEWFVPVTLPFTPDVLQEALGRLFAASGIALAQLRPYLFPHRIVDGLGAESFGGSMTVAAVLAVLAAARQARLPIFDRAAAVVQLDDKGDGDGLRSVRDSDAKLRAFVREYDRGTLLVRPADCPESSAYDHAFDEVWPVSSWRDLARFLDSQGGLDPFRTTVRLDRPLADRALVRLRSLMDDQHAYGAAQAILDELARLDAVAELPLEQAKAFTLLRIDVVRHRGFFNRGVTLARAEVRRLKRLGDDTTYDEQAQAAATHAAALFDAHRFDEIEAALRPWADLADADPRRLTPLARLMVWNTLARALVISNGPDWAELFDRSLRLQSRVDPNGRHRTLCYLIHGLLRHDRLAEAARLLARNPPDRVPNAFSRWVLAFERADLARRRDELWADPDLDEMVPVEGQVGHPIGQYLQASARQAGRSDDDASSRLAKARAFFLREIGAHTPGNLLVFLADATELARAARRGDPESWRSARDRLQEFTRPRFTAGLARYYRESLARLGDDPDLGQAETLLGLVPYF